MLYPCFNPSMYLRSYIVVKSKNDNLVDTSGSTYLSESSEKGLA